MYRKIESSFRDGEQLLSIREPLLLRRARHVPYIGGASEFTNKKLPYQSTIFETLTVPLASVPAQAYPSMIVQSWVIAKGSRSARSRRSARADNLPSGTVGMRF